ncbi:MAG TPA: DUF1059 domain-containing protein [Armatimonadota bacterium]|jgi:predicted small metal-binding protein
MPWTYTCEEDSITFVADTKEQLVEKVWEHAQQMHGMEMTRDEVMQSVNQDAQQAA